MRLVLAITTNPYSFDTEDDIDNALQDGGLKGDLESAIAREIESLMGWREVQVRIEIRSSGSIDHARLDRLEEQIRSLDVFVTRLCPE